MTKVTYCPEKQLDFVESGGHKRYLGSLPSGGKMMAMLPGWKASGMPMFDQRDWFTLSRRGRGGIWDNIFDQNGHGSCVGNGWAGAAGKIRVLGGMKEVILSPAWAYSLINGNRDQGAVISDGIEAGKKSGYATFATVGQDPIYQRQMPAAAKQEADRFKLGEAYQPESWAAVISALLTGRYIAVYGYQVGNSLENFDKNGVAGHDRGPGNHCNHSDGVALLPDGRWVLDNVNSWKKSWGPFANGRCYLDEKHLFGGGDQPDICVLEAVTDDPQEANDPPVFQP